MELGIFWCVLFVVSSTNADKWHWPEGASVRIDTKIGFLEKEHANNQNQGKRLDDEVPFHEPSETEGFYNRPPGSGRYPVRVEGHRNEAYRVDGHAIYPLKNNNHKTQTTNEYGGTLDALQFCKCLNTPECNPHQNSEAACGVGRYLCCFKRPNKVTQQNTEFFNEIEDERPMLLPGRENLARPFPPPPGSEVTGFFGSIGQPNDNNLNSGYHKQQQAVLVGPDGPTGVIGLPKPDVLVGPGGPTGIIGPKENNDDARRSESAQRGVLVGPGGPTGIIGPSYGRRPVLVGPGGPTGLIGPGRAGRGPGVLVGPGGPTGIIGPGYGRRSPAILTGPGGPTGIIGPGRPYLVGPNSQTGYIGPQYFGH